MPAKAKKQELIKLIQEIDMLLSPAIRGANEAAKKYSADSQSRLAFEVGYLNGIIKEALMHIDQVTK